MKKALALIVGASMLLMVGCSSQSDDVNSVDNSVDANPSVTTEEQGSADQSAADKHAEASGQEETIGGTAVKEGVKAEEAADKAEYEEMDEKGVTKLANDLVDSMCVSQKSLVQELIGRGVDEKLAEKVVKGLDVDYDAEAVKRVEVLQQVPDITKDAIKDDLERMQFTDKQIKKAMDKLD